MFYLNNGHCNHSIAEFYVTGGLWMCHEHLASRVFPESSIGIWLRVISIAKYWIKIPILVEGLECIFILNIRARYFKGSLDLAWCNKTQFLCLFITWNLVKDNATSRSISTAKGNIYVFTIMILLSSAFAGPFTSPLETESRNPEFVHCVHTSYSFLAHTLLWRPRSSRMSEIWLPAERRWGRWNTHSSPWDLIWIGSLWLTVKSCISFYISWHYFRV